MDQDTSVVSRRIIGKVKVAASIAIVLFSANQSFASAMLPWQKTLRRKLARIENNSIRLGRFGVYVKDLQSGRELSYRGDQTWYIASGVKIPVALEVLRQIDQGKLRLEDRVRLSADDYVDGAGETNFKLPGAQLTIRYLLEQMLIHSDNTASDLLIRKVGLDQINELVREKAGTGFWPITLLSDVRRLTYSQIDLRAANLKGQDLLLLKASQTDQQRIAMLGALLELDPDGLSQARMDQAYANYYKTRLNSATLQAYGSLLEKAWQGHILSSDSRALLLNIMERTQTGQRRIKAGLAPSLTFAHKTGTQRQRICDFGLIRDQKLPTRKPIIVSACTEGFEKERQAEAVLRDIGKAIASSGLPSFCKADQACAMPGSMQ